MSPHLYNALRCFSLGAFRTLFAELDGGVDLPFAFEEHVARGRPAFQYRPLVAPSSRCARTTWNDATMPGSRSTSYAANRLRRSSRAHTRARRTEDDALFASVLLPLLGCDRRKLRRLRLGRRSIRQGVRGLETSLFGRGHAYGAVAPLVGITLGGAPIELGPRLRVRTAATGELAKLWPEANGLLPADFGREPDRLAVLELERALSAETASPPTRPARSRTR